MQSEPAELHGTGLTSGGGASSSNLPMEDEEMKQNLVPTPPLVPWLPALRGAMADIDGFETDRKPSWFGGCSTCMFLLVFIIVLIVYIVQTGNTLATTTDQTDASTLDQMYKLSFQCVPDTPTGDYEGGTCDVVVQYTQGRTVSTNNPARPSETKYVPHPCQQYGKKADVPVGLGTDVYLCFSNGVTDGVFVKTTPNLTKASFLEAQTYYYLPQDVSGMYEVSAHLVNNDTHTVWQIIPTSISASVTATNTSSAHVRLAETYATITTTTFTNSPSLGDIGGSAFLLWLVLRFIADVHYRFTRPYAGQLEIKPQRRAP